MEKGDIGGASPASKEVGEVEIEYGRAISRTGQAPMGEVVGKRRYSIIIKKAYA